MTSEQAKNLEYPFTADEIEWRVLRTSKDKSKGQVAAFVDSRAIQKRLDAVLGRNNWQNRFCTVPGSGNTPASHICEISIYCEERKEWISKSDGAGSTDIEPIKGGLSNAFKRAASMWGVGRYLYELTNIWAVLKDGKYIDESEKPRLDKLYNQFAKQILAKSNARQQALAARNSATPTSTAEHSTAAAKQQSEQPEIAPGRFSSPTAEPHTSQRDLCEVVDLKVSKGGHGMQTLLTLKKADGSAISGYFRGEAQLHRGQTICDLKITPKKSAVVGDYNIIESYRLAA